MPLPDIDFHRIRGYGVLGSRADGFEELATQLLEDELVSWPARVQFERFGNPDGGREGRAVLPDGAVWAWQAKYLFTMDTDELGQIGKSVIRALEREPRLEKYFVLMPYDLPAGDREDARSAHTKWTERVATWKTLAADRGMRVEFEYIGAHQMTAALTRSPQVGRLRYWFDIESFHPAWFVGIAERAAAQAGPRYQRELHVDLPIAGVFAGLGQTEELELSVRKLLAALRSARLFGWRSPPEHEQALGPLLDAVEPALDRLDAALASIVASVGTGPMPMPGVSDELSLVNAALDPLAEKLAELCQEQDGYYVGDAGFLYSSIQAVWSLLRDLRDLIDGPVWRSAQRRFLVLTGEWGTGKTHLLCDIAKTRAVAGLPTVIALGQHFDSRAPLVQLSELLHFGGAPDELLPTLNAAAQAAGRRGLVIIDALNEASPPEMWQEHLAGLVREVLAQPWLVLAISCRTPYLDLAVPKAALQQGERVEHTGFGERAADAVGRYLEFFGIEEPGFPLLNPELANPLFLRLLCEALQARGERQFPRSGVGTLWLFDQYLEAVNKRLSRRDRCDYDERAQLVHHAVRDLAELQRVSGHAAARAEATEIAQALLPGRPWSSSLLKGLLSEGVIVATRLAGTEYVQFGYQRLGDIAVAALICTQSAEAASTECQQLAASWVAHAGVLEALAVILPETHRLELVDAIADSIDDNARSQASRVMLAALPLRAASSITPRTVNWLDSLASRRPFQPPRGLLWPEVITTSLGLSCVPEHPLNADWLHHQLSSMSLSDRDLFWTRLCNGAFGNVRTVGQLVSWAWSPAARSADDEVCRLAAITLGWLLTSTRRPVRDRATKALTHLIEGRPSIYATVIADFAGVDDPYVWERLLAAGCGLCLRSAVPGDRVIIGSAIAKHTLQAHQWPEHLLARDYARRAIESALSAGWDAPAGTAEAVRPPYGLPWPVPARSSDQIDAMTGPPGYPYGSVKGSVIGQFGDFNKYVISPALECMQLPDEEGTDLVARRVFDRVLELGWSPERFTEADAKLQWDPGQGQVTERLGKKYQWIAFREALAHVTDCRQVGGNYSGEPVRPYDSPADLEVRDIDPTLLLQFGQHFGYDGGATVWFAPSTVGFTELQPDTWLSSVQGLPDPAGLLVVHDPSGTAWLSMEGYYRWAEAIPPDEELKVPRRRLWYQLRSYIFSAADTAALETWVRSQRLYGRWMPESAENIGVLLADYPGHPSWRFTTGGKHHWGGHLPPPTCLTPTAAWYMGAGSTYDCSSIEAVHGLLPSAALCELIQASQHGEFRFMDSSGRVVAEDFAIRVPGPASLHVLADHLTGTCAEHGLSILWTVVGEKQLEEPGITSSYREGELISVDVEAAYILDRNGVRLIKDSASRQFVGTKPGEPLTWPVSSNVVAAALNRGSTGVVSMIDPSHR